MTVEIDLNEAERAKTLILDMFLNRKRIFNLKETTERHQLGSRPFGWPGNVKTTIDLKRLMIHARLRNRNSDFSAGCRLLPRYLVNSSTVLK